jgi:hypothetical protein
VLFVGLIRSAGKFVRLCRLLKTVCKQSNLGTWKATWMERFLCSRLHGAVVANVGSSSPVSGDCTEASLTGMVPVQRLSFRSSWVSVGSKPRSEHRIKKSRPVPFLLSGPPGSRGVQ